MLENVRLSFDRSGERGSLEIACRKAEYLDGVWWLFHPSYKYFDAFSLPVENPHPDLAALSVRAFPEFDETPRDFLLTNKLWEHHTTRDMLHYLKAHPRLEADVRASKRYDIGARLIAPFACLVITLFAIPAGVITGRQSVFKGVVSAVAMFFGFYAAHMLCMVLAKNLLLPVPLAVALPDLAFLAAGLALFRRQR